MKHMKNKTYINALFFFLMAMFIGGLLCSQVVEALNWSGASFAQDKYDELDDTCEDVFSGVTDYIKWTFSDNDTLGSWTVLNPIYKLVFGDITDSSSTLSSIFGATYLIFKTIGMLILIGLGLAEIIKEVERGQDQVESILKVLIKICLIMILMVELDNIVNWLNELAMSVLSTIKITSGNTITRLHPEEIIQGMPGWNDPSSGDYIDPDASIFTNLGPLISFMFWYVGASLMLKIVWIVSLVLKAALIYSLISLFLEMGIRRLLLPIGVVDCYHEGFRSNGARFLKKYFSCALKPAFMMLSVILYNAFTVEIFSNQESGFFAVVIFLVMSFALIGFINKGNEILDQMLGC